MKRVVKKVGFERYKLRSFLEKYNIRFKKEVAWLDNYAEAVIIVALLGFSISILLKLVFPNLEPTQINSLTAYRFSGFMILLSLALLLHRQKSS